MAAQLGLVINGPVLAAADALLYVKRRCGSLLYVKRRCGSLLYVKRRCGSG